MTIQSTCPGCGASLQIEDQADEVICQFCGTHFHVNLDGVEPALRVATPPAEPAPSAAETILTPTGEIYNPPVPGTAPVAPAELYNPPIPTAGPGAYGEPPQPYSPSPVSQAPSTLFGRLSGSRLWIAIAAVVVGVFCLSCLCMLAFAMRIAR